MFGNGDKVVAAVEFEGDFKSNFASIDLPNSIQVRIEKSQLDYVRSVNAI